MKLDLYRGEWRGLKGSWIGWHIRVRTYVRDVTGFWCDAVVMPGL